MLLSSKPLDERQVGWRRKTEPMWRHGMSGYETMNKTEWFIQKMRSGWFSRRGIVDLAETEFPDVSRKTLEGTIGQYWTDSVNPEWPTYKAIRARGLKIAKDGHRRRIVEDSGRGSSPSGMTGAKAPADSRRALPGIPLTAGGSPRLPDATFQRQGTESRTRELWNSNSADLWEWALDRYWSFVKASNLALEKEMDRLDINIIKAMTPQAWYWFLLDKYFRWKFTAPNRYASTTKSFRSYEANSMLQALHAIRDRLFAVDKDDIQKCLIVAKSIKGLGTAGASGLLAILFPAHFGTVDQFVVKALAELPELPERALIAL
jgi:hypothetical protein